MGVKANGEKRFPHSQQANSIDENIVPRFRQVIGVVGSIMSTDKGAKFLLNTQSFHQRFRVSTWTVLLMIELRSVANCKRDSSNSPSK